MRCRSCPECSHKHRLLPRSSYYSPTAVTCSRIAISYTQRRVGAQQPPSPYRIQHFAAQSTNIPLHLCHIRQASAGRTRTVLATAGTTEIDPPQRPFGYTPYEYVTFTHDQMTHDVSSRVARPVSVIFKAWKDPENYGEWFDLVGQTILHDDKPELTSFFLYYQWGQLPAIELYTTLIVDEEEEDAFLRFLAVDGMKCGFQVTFEAEEECCTLINLRVGYLLPANLAYNVGPVGIWGDVNDILIAGLRNMKDPGTTDVANALVGHALIKCCWERGTCHFQRMGQINCGCCATGSVGTYLSVNVELWLGASNIDNTQI